MVIKDKIALGTAAGIAATIPQLIVNVFLVIFGFSVYYSPQLAASVFIYKYLTYQLWGMLFGLLVWESMAAGLGIFTVYLIYWTGRDFWWLKGLLVSNTLMFIFMYGFYFGLGAPKIDPLDLGTNWSLFIENLVFGLGTSYLAIRWGGDYLKNKKLT